ncbi:uncharacterized protein LOC131220028 [Magnolia sinica]|uniref:uncharacterized protein LOC131220028 n=1 Tax=Magnolia sinica TaxID=86752 RepID=UPI0026587AA4|nr:uncharacterized protein LOC131220028 [Magnolia sinica]
MTPEDEEAMAFRTPLGIYCYKVMQFGLKNAGATYQRAMQNIFQDIMHKHVECYVDDLVVRSNHHEEHCKHLASVFHRIRKKLLKMNPAKCVFRVSSGKFLGFVVRYKCIEIDSKKVRDIQDMPPPKTLKELKSLQGKPHQVFYDKANVVGEAGEVDVTVTYESAKEVKGQAVADFLATYPVMDCKAIFNEFPNEQVMVIELLNVWKMFFDGAARAIGAASELEIKALRIYGDSKLVINQHIPRHENARADPLANLAAALSHTNRSPLQVTIEEKRFLPLADIISDTMEALPISCLEVTIDDWHQPFIDYLKYDILLEDSEAKLQVKQRMKRFITCSEGLYRRSYNEILL